MFMCSIPALASACFNVRYPTTAKTHTHTHTHAQTHTEPGLLLSLSQTRTHKHTQCVQQSDRVGVGGVCLMGETGDHGD